MGQTSRDDERGATPATLGDILDAREPSATESERDWIALVRKIANGDQLALHALYERAHRVVYTLTMRITNNREASEELTLDVFHDVWRRASSYGPANGTVLGWITNQARSRAIDRVRFEQRKKRVGPIAVDAEPVEEFEFRDLIELAEEGEKLREALGVLTNEERQAIEVAFLSESSHAEVAARLELPLGTVKTRIRSGLRKLREALKP